MTAKDDHTAAKRRRWSEALDEAFEPHLQHDAHVRMAAAVAAGLGRSEDWTTEAVLRRAREWERGARRERGLP